MTNLHLFGLGVLSCALVKNIARGTVLLVLDSRNGPDGVLQAHGWLHVGRRVEVLQVPLLIDDGYGFRLALKEGLVTTHI